MYSRFSRDVTAAMLVYRTTFAIVLYTNMSHHVSENQEY